MLATFCARLALGLLLCLLLVSPQVLHPRYFRTQFVTVLGLSVVATLAAWPGAAGWLRVWLLASCTVALLGTWSWTLDPAPFGRSLVSITIGLLAGVLFQLDGMSSDAASELSPWSRAAISLSAAAFLGAGLTAMLVGHSYLISPGMTLTPLMRLLAALAIAALVRAAVCGYGIWRWSTEQPAYTLTDDVVLWLPWRWLVGIVAPVGFGWMAYASAKIRSTQSATGILYVVVVCSFLGELLSLLLTNQTGLPL